jgi:Ca2+-binding EF-hand superfamily protein
MMNKRASIKLIKTSTKLLDLTRGKLELKQQKKASSTPRLPPISSVKIRGALKCRQVNLGTISIIKQQQSKAPKKKLLMNKHLTNSNRNKLKLKTIHWLISNYKEEIDLLLDNCRILIQQSNNQGYISYQNFEDIMSSLGPGTDKSLVDRMFWVFDENGDGKIEPREIMVGLEMFRETSFKEKLEVFFNICDDDGSGDIDEEEFYNVLKLCVNTVKERKMLRESLHELFVAIDENGNGVLTKEEIIKAADASEAVKSIIEKSIMTCHGVDTWIANDFYTGVNTQNFLSIGHRQNGVCHKEIESLVNAFQIEENLYEKDLKLKQDNIKKLNYWKKENNHLDLSFDDKRKEVIYSNDGHIIDY